MNDAKNNSVDQIFQLSIQDYINNVDTGILVTDETDTICWVNEYLLTPPKGRPEVKLMVGKKLAQGIEFFKEFHAHADYFKQTILTFSRERKPRFGMRSALINGTFTEVNYIPIFSAEGHFMGAIWQSIPKIEQDNEAMPLSKSSENISTHTFDQLGFLFCSISPKGKIRQYSSLFSRFMGYLKEDLSGLNFFDFCPDGKRKIDTCLIPDSNGTDNLRNNFEVGIKTIEGEKWIRCFILDDSDATETSQELRLFMMDITEQKDLQRELEDARVQAEKAQVAQQQFLASMSHDIRTPLNAIIGMTMMMEDTSLTEKQKEYFTVLKNASNILLGLLNDILDFAKIETGQQEIHENEFDLHQMISAMVDTFYFKLKGKAVELTYEMDTDIDTLLLGDAQVLNQILMNLLTNAEKFTEEGEIHLSISVEKTYENAVWVQFCVEDTGIGISEKDLAKIFQDFKRVGDTSSEYDGSGLGLFISKRLVGLMGGELKVKSILGKGTSFYFSLPFEKTSIPIQSPEKTSSFSPDLSIKEDVYLLIVEDNPMNRTYISELLQKEKISFDLVKDGKEGWIQAKEKSYDLILTDMRLPSMSGIELATSIREKQNPNGSTPIILFSALAFKESVDNARKVGINDFLPKPFTPKQLLYLLHKYLKDTSAFPEEESEKEGKSSDFRFDKHLDTGYLEHLYADNIKYAQSLFRIFLDEINEDMEEIIHAIQLQDWEKLRELGHRIKPNFSMVGLTKLTRDIQNVNNKVKAGDPKAAVALFHALETELKQKLPVVKNEFRRMQNWLSTPPNGGD